MPTTSKVFILVVALATAASLAPGSGRLEQIGNLSNALDFDPDRSSLMMRANWPPKTVDDFNAIFTRP